MSKISNPSAPTYHQLRRRSEAKGFPDIGLYNKFSQIVERIIYPWGSAASYNLSMFLIPLGFVILCILVTIHPWIGVGTCLAIWAVSIVVSIATDRIQDRCRSLGLGDYFRFYKS